MVYAGAAQYMMVPMLAAGLPVGTIMLATLVINLRHVFYGLSLLDRLPDRRGLRWALAFCLTDETYSVLTALPRSTPAHRLVGVALLNQGWWVLGTALGALLGTQLPLNLQGLDFVLAALFGVLTVEQWRQRHSAAPLWTALAAYAVAQAAAPAHALAIAIALSLLAGLVWPAHPRAVNAAEHRP